MVLNIWGYLVRASSAGLNPSKRSDTEDTIGRLTERCIWLDKRGAEILYSRDYKLTVL